MRILIVCVILALLLMFCYEMTTSIIPLPEPKSNLTEQQWKKLVKRCGGSTIVDESGNEKCFYTKKDLVKIKARLEKRRKIYAENRE